MRENISQDCPLCGVLANYYLVTNLQRKYFGCTACGYFQITKSAEKSLLAGSQHVRQAFADRAKLAPEDNVFVILTPPRHGADPADPKVTGSFIHRDQLDL